MLGDQSPDFNSSWQKICSTEIVADIRWYAEVTENVADNVLPNITLVLSIIGLIVNGAFIFFGSHGIKEKLLPYKAYCLLLNRSIIDVVIGFFTVLFVALRHTETVQFDVGGDIDVNTENEITVNPNLTSYTQLTLGPAYPLNYSPPTTTLDPTDDPYASTRVDYLIPHGRTIFTLMLTINFWAVAGSYATLALFTYIAVRYPIYYQVSITKRRTVMAMVANWVVGIVYSILVVTLSSNDAFNVFQSADDLTRWKVSGTDYVLSISNLLIVILALLLVTCSYVGIIIYLWRKSRLSGKASMHLVNIGRLGLNIFAFSVTCIVMAGFVSLPLFLKEDIDSLINTNTNKGMCNTILGTYKLSYQMIVWTTVAMAGWCFRMILDPMANFLLDRRFNVVVNSVFKTKKSGFYSTNELQARFLIANEFLRKCAEHNVVPISVIRSDGHYFRFASGSTRSDNRLVSNSINRSNITSDNRLVSNSSNNNK